MLKLGSLFDGSGTCPLTAQMCGVEPVWASEIEPFPIAVTKSRFPNMKHLGDIMKINGGEIEPVDVITFGSPCQNLSTAGNREGLTGSESSLFIEAIRVIREMMDATNGKYPRVVVWENVTGAFSTNKGEDFRRVLEEFCKIKDCDTVISRPPKGKWSDAGEIMGDGYSLAWRVLDAQFWGVPQRRRRIFLVCDFRGGRAAGEILFERGGLSRGFETRDGERKTVTGVFRASDSKHNFLAPSAGFKHKAGRAAGSVSFAIEMCSTLLANQESAVVVPVLFTAIREVPAKYRKSEVSATLLAQHSGKLKNVCCVPIKSDENYVYLARRLTPTECASLQGFPKDWCALVPHKDAPEYKMWGNGMALPCMLYVMEGITEVLKEEET